MTTFSVFCKNITYYNNYHNKDGFHNYLYIYIYMNVTQPIGDDLILHEGGREITVPKENETKCHKINVYLKIIHTIMTWLISSSYYTI